MYISLCIWILGYSPALVERWNFLPPALIILIYACYAIGYCNVPVQLTGELLPAESKAVGNALVQLIEVMLPT